jgi:hypothetical protein
MKMSFHSRTLYGHLPLRAGLLAAQSPAPAQVLALELDQARRRGKRSALNLWVAFYRRESA